MAEILAEAGQKRLAGRRRGALAKAKGCGENQLR